jgi:hypothetical protein
MDKLTNLNLPHQPINLFRKLPIQGYGGCQRVIISCLTCELLLCSIYAKVLHVEKLDSPNSLWIVCTVRGFCSLASKFCCLAGIVLFLTHLMDPQILIVVFPLAR